MVIRHTLLAYGLLQLTSVSSGWSVVTSRWVDDQPPPVLDVAGIGTKSDDYRYSDINARLTAIKDGKLKSCFVSDYDPLWLPKHNDKLDIIKSQPCERIKSDEELHALKRKAGPVIATMCKSYVIFWLNSQNVPPPPPLLSMIGGIQPKPSKCAYQEDLLNGNRDINYNYDVLPSDGPPSLPNFAPRMSDSHDIEIPSYIQPSEEKIHENQPQPPLLAEAPPLIDGNKGPHSQMQGNSEIAPPIRLHEEEISNDGLPLPPFRAEVAPSAIGSINVPPPIQSNGEMVPPMLSHEKEFSTNQPPPLRAEVAPPAIENIDIPSQSNGEMAPPMLSHEKEFSVNERPPLMSEVAPPTIGNKDPASPMRDTLEILPPLLQRDLPEALNAPPPLEPLQPFNNPLFGDGFDKRLDASELKVPPPLNVWQKIFANDQTDLEEPVAPPKPDIKTPLPRNIS